MIIIALIIISLLLCFTLYMSWKKNKILKIFQNMRRSGNTFIIPPEVASYRGATAKYGRAKCDGVIGMTKDKIIFCPLMGKTLTIDLHCIKDVSQTKKFLGQYRAGMTVMVLHTDRADIGFFVSDHMKWQNSIIGIIK
jgi:hypothetical protein